ncbi:YIP1 family protein [Humidesulfovibrio sp.]
MRILCPLCGFAREIDESKVPPRAQMATCPKCSHKFRFRVVDDLEPYVAPWATSPAPGSTPGSQGGFPAGPAPDAQARPDAPTNAADQADPMAAQRASAAEAWKRLQSKAATPPSAPPASPSASAGDAPGNDSGNAGDPYGVAPSPRPGFGEPLDSGAPLAPSSDGPARNAAEPAGATPWPTPGEPKSTGSPVPFEDLPRHGFFPGLWATIRAILTGPSAFFRAMPTSGGMTKPLIFHLLLAEFMMASQYLWGMAGLGATAEFLNSPGLMELGLGASEAAPVLLFIVYPLLLVLRLMLMTGVIHLLLRLLRSGEFGAEATFRVLCYSAAPLMLGLVPGIGPLVGGVWSVGLTILGLKYAHRTSISAALFAVLVPILMMLAAVVGLLQGMGQAG